jgi:hypothetical protein
MDISLILTILGSTLGPLVLIYFWLRHLRTDLISHIDKVVLRLDNHMEDENVTRRRRHESQRLYFFE